MEFGSIWTEFEFEDTKYHSWVMSGYIVCEVAAIPVAGKIIDHVGGRKVLITGACVFMAGAVLSAISVNTAMLVVSRMIQGIGAGTVFATAFGMVGILYEDGERGKPHELMTAAFALGSLYGTAMGWWFVENLGWRWTFVFVTALMAAGMTVAIRYFPRDHPERRGNYDVPGLVILTVLMVLALVYTQTVDINYDMLSWLSIALLATMVILCIILVMRCRRASDPAFPTFITRMQAKMMFLMFAFSACGLGLVQYFFKYYLLHFAPDIYSASLMFLFLLAGGACTSLPGCRMVRRTGVRPWITCGAVLVGVALLILHFIGGRDTLCMGIGLFFFGMGLGCIVTEIVCAMQGMTQKKDMVSVTSTTMALRMLGILVGNVVVYRFIRNCFGNEIGDFWNFTDVSSVVAILEELANGITKAFDAFNEGIMWAVVAGAVTCFLLALLAYDIGDSDKVPEPASEEKDE